MKVYMLEPELENYNTLRTLNSIDRKKMQFEGKKQDEDWVPVVLEKVEKKTKFSDSPHLTCSVTIFNEKALNCLYDLIKDDVQALSLICAYGDFKAINVTTVLDCVDYEHSVFKRFDDGRIMVFYTYAFKPEKIGNHKIFKLIDEPKR